MKAFIFTHPPDYKIAYLAYEALKNHAKVDEVVLAYDHKHEKPDSNFQSIETKFQRFGNLNGVDFMKGALDLYAKEAVGHDTILKVDSDTMVFNTTWVKPETVLSGFEYEPYRCFYGMAYSLRTDAIPLIKDLLDVTEFPINFPEDVMIYELCKDLGVTRHSYNEKAGPWAGWNWLTLKDVKYYREAFEVINVYPPRGFSPENSKRIIHSKMKQLLEHQ